MFPLAFLKGLMTSSNKHDGTHRQLIIPDLVLVANDEGARKLSNLSLVGNICSNKSIGKNVVFMILRRVWFTEEHIKIEELDKHFPLFFQERGGPEYSEDEAPLVSQHRTLAAQRVKPRPRPSRY